MVPKNFSSHNIYIMCCFPLLVKLLLIKVIGLIFFAWEEVSRWKYLSRCRTSNSFWWTRCPIIETTAASPPINWSTGSNTRGYDCPNPYIARPASIKAFILIRATTSNRVQITLWLSIFQISCIKKSIMISV